jgi:hypothetical protein
MHHLGEASQHCPLCHLTNEASGQKATASFLSVSKLRELESCPRPLGLGMADPEPGLQSLVSFSVLVLQSPCPQSLVTDMNEVYMAKSIHTRWPYAGTPSALLVSS